MSIYKKINFLLVIKIIGILLLIEGLAMSLAIPFSIYYGRRIVSLSTLYNGKDDLTAIILSVIITLIVGIFLFIIAGKSDKRTFGKHEGFLLVTLAWFSLIIFGTLPFLFSGTIPSFTDAFFETSSGFTTTGLSLIPEVESIPKGILFWRSMTHWIGGMGIMMMFLALMPMIGVKGGMVYAAETSGDLHDKLHPRIKETARRLWLIYLSLSFTCFGLLMLGGLGFFDSVCFTFGTMATGGFSTLNTGFVNQSPYIHYVVILFMALAATNFNTHYLFIKLHWRKALKNEEFKVYWGIIIVSTIIIFIGLCLNGSMSKAEFYFRESLFHVVSVLTTTGYFISDFTLWPYGIWIFLFLISFICGMSGSTTGGVKVWRHIILFKNYKQELKRQIHPQAVIPVRYNKVPVSEETINTITAFFYFFMTIFFVSFVFLMMTGMDFKTSAGTAITCLANIGIGVGDIAKPYSGLSGVNSLVVWWLSILMIIGRLELFTVLVIFNKSFWKR